MKISLVNCIVVFVVGWIGGLLIIQFLFDKPKSKSLRSSFTAYEPGDQHPSSKSGVVGLLSSVGKAISEYSSGRTATPAPTPVRKHRYLPKFPKFNSSSNSPTGKEEQMYIYMDWPADSRLFTVDNYKALESLLNVYPTAVFRCLIATSRDAYAHKIGNALSVTQFAKYRKRQYNINVVPVNTKQKSRTSSLGEKYREKWYNQCCAPCNATCRGGDHTQPYHLLNYIRLTNLWQNGGIFSDFSFFFLGPVTSSEVQQGYAINSWCGNQYHLESWQQLQRDASGAGSTVAGEDTATAAAAAEGTSGGSQKSSRHDCATSTLLVFNAPQHEAVLCVLAKYDDSDFLDCIAADNTHGGALCVKNAFDQCFASLKLKNGLASISSDAAPTSQVVGSDVSVLEMFDENAFRASNTLLSYDWSLEPEKRVFWLGSLAWTGSWKNYPYRNGTLLAAAVRQISLQSASLAGTAAAATQCKVANPPTCHHYATNLSSLRGHKNEYDTERKRAMFVSPRKARFSYQTGIEEASCAPSVVIAGFQKSASTFLFDAITRHPSVLPALVGAQHKETHCYGADRQKPGKLLQRAWCFPFIEAGEALVSVDGTVAYDIDQTAPLTMKEDNPGMKVIFVVRNPVERLYSSFKFAYSTYAKFGNFDEFILPGTDLGRKFGDLREMVTNGTDISDAVSYYYNSTYEDSPARGALFMHSLYALPVAHYISVFGRENVKVVSAEALDVRDQVRLYDTLNEVFTFIGVCPLPIADLVPSLPSRNTVPLSNQMSQDMFSRLTRFFRPFNNLLSTLTGLNVTHWNTKAPPQKLPKFSPLNETMPELWFEIKEAATKKSHFLPQLLPQRTAEEKSGFNTTIGMLNSF